MPGAVQNPSFQHEQFRGGGAKRPGHRPSPITTQPLASRFRNTRVNPADDPRALVHAVLTANPKATLRFEFTPIKKEAFTTVPLCSWAFWCDTVAIDNASNGEEGLQDDCCCGYVDYAQPWWCFARMGQVYRGEVEKKECCDDVCCLCCIGSCDWCFTCCMSTLWSPVNCARASVRAMCCWPRASFKAWKRGQLYTLKMYTYHKERETQSVERRGDREVYRYKQTTTVATIIADESVLLSGSDRYVLQRGVSLASMTEEALKKLEDSIVENIAKGELTFRQSQDDAYARQAIEQGIKTKTIQEVRFIKKIPGSWRFWRKREIHYCW